MKLCHKNGDEVQIGDLVTSFRGEEANVTGWAEPHKPGSTGRVYVKWVGYASTTEYYPSVFDLSWEPDHVHATK